MEKMIKSFVNQTQFMATIVTVLSQFVMVQEDKGIKCEQEGFMLIQKWTQALKCSCIV